MPKKRFFVTVIYFVFLLLFSLVSFSAPLPANDGSLSCSNFPPDNYDSCYDYPKCWMNGGCTTEEPVYSHSFVYDYECISGEYRKEKIKECKWAYCDGATLKYNRNCGIDGACSYSETADCNSYDGIYDYFDCYLATGGGPIGSSSCGPGEEPKVVAGTRYDYGCIQEGVSARCRKVGTISCSSNPAGCDSFLKCADGISVHCAEECDSEFMRDGVCRERGAAPIPTCFDKTPLNTCSSTKPKFCDVNANLINNCSRCGCLSGQTCQADGSCSAPAVVSPPPTSKCNNNNKTEGDEQCDGRDLSRKTCISSSGYAGGILTCKDCILDWTKCVSRPRPAGPGACPVEMDLDTSAACCLDRKYKWVRSGEPKAPSPAADTPASKIACSGMSDLVFRSPTTEEAGSLLAPGAGLVTAPPPSLGCGVRMSLDLLGSFKVYNERECIFLDPRIGSSSGTFYRGPDGKLYSRLEMIDKVKVDQMETDGKLISSQTLFASREDNYKGTFVNSLQAMSVGKKIYVMFRRNSIFIANPLTFDVYSFDIETKAAKREWYTSWDFYTMFFGGMNFAPVGNRFLYMSWMGPAPYVPYVSYIDSASPESSAVANTRPITIPLTELRGGDKIVFVKTTGGEGFAKMNCFVKASASVVDSQFQNPERNAPETKRVAEQDIEFCLGDDPGEPGFAAFRRCDPGLCITDLNDNAACDKPSDCVFNGKCYSDIKAVAKEYFNNNKTAVKSSPWLSEVSADVYKDRTGILETCDPGKWILDTCIDLDKDKYGAPVSRACAFPGLDCNDNNPNINPRAKEICNDLDDNCNSIIDEGCDDDKDNYCDSGMII